MAHLPWAQPCSGCRSLWTQGSGDLSELVTKTLAVLGPVRLHPSEERSSVLLDKPNSRSDQRPGGNRRVVKALGTGRRPEQGEEARNTDPGESPLQEA